MPLKSMKEKIKYIFKDWENELLEIAQGAVECIISSAYLNQSGISLLEKIAKRLTTISGTLNKNIIKVLLSDKFAPTVVERVRILTKLQDLPNTEIKIFESKCLFHRKNYIFSSEDEIKVFVGSVNTTTAGLFKNVELATLTTHSKDDEEALSLINNFNDLWSSAKQSKVYLEGQTMLENPPKFQVGDNVIYKSTNDIGTINKVLEGRHNYSYKVTINGKIKTIFERDLELYVDLEQNIIDDYFTGNYGTFEDFQIFHTWLRLAKPIENNLYSFLSSKTLFNPYQFKPLLRFLSPESSERLFIADEVGVGKTIESGIILCEMISRGRIDSNSPILIVCPNSLGPKWVKEMKNRFGLGFHFHDSKSFKFTVDTVLQDGLFPRDKLWGVISIQLLRREDMLEKLTELANFSSSNIFKMVIIDEAHHLRNPETFNNQMGNLLSNMTDMMLMLSATPINLKNEDLFNQLHILNPAIFPNKVTFEMLQEPAILINKIRHLLSKSKTDSCDEILEYIYRLQEHPIGKIIASHHKFQKLINQINSKIPFSNKQIIEYERSLVSLSPLYHSFTRTRKREALEHQVQREVLELSIKLSQDEMDFYEKLMDVLRQYYLEKGISGPAINLVLNIHQRMVSSCIPATIDYLNWCIQENTFNDSVTDESMQPEDDSELETTILSVELKEKFLELIADAKKIEDTDSKYVQFKTMLDKMLNQDKSDIKQVLIFSFFVRTLKYLKKRLSNDGYSTGIIHGEIPLTGDKSNPGRYEVMDAFKQGEFQILLSSEVGGEGIDFQFCHAMVNYDLPYNPMRIEQRIGRLDRFGQKSDKILVSNLFIANTIDEEIYDKLYRRIKIVEDGIGAFEPILGKEIADIQNAIINGNLSEEQKEEKMRRVSESIISAKLEMEEFEKYRKELLSDDYLNEPLNNLKKNNNFITPADVLQLTEYFTNQYEKCSFEKENDFQAKLKLNNEIITDLQNFMRKKENHSSVTELGKLTTNIKNIKVIFDGSEADKNPDYHFLPPTGHWAKYVTQSLYNNNKIKNVFCFKVDNLSKILPTGNYIVFLFEIRIEGFRTELELISIPVNMTDTKIPDIDYYNLSRIISNIASAENQKISECNIEDYYSLVRDKLEMVIDEKRTEITSENKFHIESRISALEKSTEIFVRKIEQEIERHISNRKNENRDPDEKYLKLKTSQITNQKKRAAMKIEELNKQKNLTIDYNLSGIIEINIGG